MGLLRWIRSKLFGEPKEKGDECRIPRSRHVKYALWHLKFLDTELSLINRFIVEPLTMLGFEVKKSSEVKCYGDKWSCLSELRKRALEALKEMKFKEAAELAGKCIALIEQMKNEIWSEICR